MKVIYDKALSNYLISCYEKTSNEAIDQYKAYVHQIPKPDDLMKYKRNNPKVYNMKLESLILDYGLIDELKEKLKSSMCLRNRKSILLKVIKLYEQNEFEIFNNILPIQIEGIFGDFLKDTTTFSRFKNMNIYNNAVLKKKIDYLPKDIVENDLKVIKYFKFYFNDIIRNKIAHGRYCGDFKEVIQDEIFSKELMLDMILLVHMVLRQSETEKMHRFVNGYRESIYKTDHNYFETLFNDMTGARIIFDYDSIATYRPIQLAYWLVNPHYEKIYEQVNDNKALLELRNMFLSKGFWEHVLTKLNVIIADEFLGSKFNREFICVVRGLFSCNISDEVKQVLSKVSASALKIKTLQDNENNLD